MEANSQLPTLDSFITSTNNPPTTNENLSFKVDMCQIIFYDFAINKEIGEYLQRVKFVDVGINYNTIAIIGPQSSGKSTLLNLLFDTNFEVMNSSIKRGQTTKGVWFAGHKEKKVLIIDCEGTDSKERAEEDRGKFEHSSSLFSLALSDVLIINMWTSDVGRYTASNYGVLKIVFEMNLKLFQQECAKKILIILRDFDPKRNQKDKIESLILSDINKIWAEIKKPDKFKGSSPDQFFTFEFITLPHKKYLPEQFKNEVFQLRERLDEKHEKYIFSHLSQIKSIPADGLQQYVIQLWENILNEKELNIPSQKEMLANFRCNEIKQTVLNDNDSAIKELVKQSNDKTLDDFNAKCTAIHDKILNDYDKAANNYDDKIYKQIRSQLENAVIQKLYVCFLNQIKRAIPVIQKYMRKSLEKELTKLSQSGDYLTISEKTRSQYVKILAQKLKEKKVFDSWKVDEKEYNHIFDEIIETQKTKSLELEKKQTLETLKEQTEKMFFLCLENFKGDFWGDFNNQYIRCLYFKLKPFEKYLLEQFNTTQEETNELIDDIISSLETYTKKIVNQNMKDITNVMKDLFKKKFWNDDENKPKNWNRYEEDEIDALFKSVRNEYINIFDSFKTANMIKEPFKFIGNDFDKQTDEEKQKKIDQSIQDSIAKEEFENLLKPNEILAMKRKYDNDIANFLEDAKRRREGFSFENIPIWYYILILVFGIDDLIRIVKNVKLLTALLILAGVLFALKKMDKLHKVREIYFDIEEFVAKIRKGISNFIKKKLNKF